MGHINLDSPLSASEGSRPALMDKLETAPRSDSRYSPDTADSSHARNDGWEAGR